MVGISRRGREHFKGKEARERWYGARNDLPLSPTS
jgi:hypothetical protein